MKSFRVKVVGRLNKNHKGGKIDECKKTYHGDKKIGRDGQRRTIVILKKKHRGIKKTSRYFEKTSEELKKISEKF